MPNPTLRRSAARNQIIVGSLVALRSQVALDPSGRSSDFVPKRAPVSTTLANIFLLGEFLLRVRVAATDPLSCTGGNFSETSSPPAPRCWPRRSYHRAAAAQHDVRVRVAAGADDARRAVLVHAEKTVRIRVAPIASIATCRLPSVEFFKPTGMESPLAISRCVCDSVVRAPMAAQVIKSAMYWRNNWVEKFRRRRQAMPTICNSSFRARFKPSRCPRTV